MKLLVLCCLTAVAVSSPSETEDPDSTSSSLDITTENPTSHLYYEPINTQSTSDDSTELPTTTVEDKWEEIIHDTKDDAVIPQYYYVNDGTGNYTFGFEERGGIKFETRGVIKNEGTKDQYIAVEGLFQWVDRGRKESVKYVTDKNGFPKFTVTVPLF